MAFAQRDPGAEAKEKELQQRFKNEIKEIMLSYLANEKNLNNEYYKRLTDYIERGGHYTRPMLFIYAAQAFGLKPDRNLMLMAATIEMSEEAILKYDDMQDHSVFRRGDYTTNYRYGDELAVLYASVLQDKMRQIFEDYLQTLKPVIAAKLRSKVDEITRVTPYGQERELLFIYNIRDFSKVDESLYYEIVKGKTAAYTIYGPLQFAAIVAGQSDTVIESLQKIGEPAGIAFQINDDVQDFLYAKKLGKTPYGDLYEGKYTLIMAHAYKMANDEDKAFINSVYSKRREEKTPEEIKRLVSIVYKTKSLEYAIEQRDMYMKIALSEFSKYANYLEANKATIELARMILNILSRDGVDASELMKAKRD